MEEKYALDAGKEIHLLSGKKIVVESAATLTLKTPGGFIEMDSTGITIVGKIVKVNSGGVASTGSGAEPEDAQDAVEATIVDPVSLVGSSS